MTKDVISLSISVLLLFRHYISHKIIFGAPSSGGVLCSACGAFIANLSNAQPQSIRYSMAGKKHCSGITVCQKVSHTSPIYMFIFQLDEDV